MSERKRVAVSERKRGTTLTARLKERAVTAAGMVALAGFVVVGGCAAVSMSLWEVCRELQSRHAGSSTPSAVPGHRCLVPTTRRAVAVGFTKPERDRHSADSG
ncbi:MAG TPA: hypothetical protein VHZ02_06670 [Acidimicrobiales bacterium]|nr:hypothetical protein [Acidimicrobiales bacterium]